MQSRGEEVEVRQDGHDRETQRGQGVESARMIHSHETFRRERMCNKSPWEHPDPSRGPGNLPGVPCLQRTAPLLVTDRSMQQCFLAQINPVEVWSSPVSAVWASSKLLEMRHACPITCAANRPNMLQVSL